MCEENSLKLTIPPEYPSAFSYIVTKVSEGCDKAFTSLYPPLMKVLALCFYLKPKMHIMATHFKDSVTFFVFAMYMVTFSLERLPNLNFSHYKGMAEHSLIISCIVLPPPGGQRLPGSCEGNEKGWKTVHSQENRRL